MLALRDLAQEHSKLWAFNGIVGGYHHQLADLAFGEVTVLRVWNDTRWEHGMHLHGHHFWVDSKKFGDKALPVLRDTYLIARVSAPILSLLLTILECGCSIAI